MSWPKVELPRYDLVLPPTPQSLIGPSRLRLLKRLDQAARSRSSSVTQVESFLLWKRQRVLIANSENLWVEDERPYVRVGVTVTVEDSGQRESAYARLGALASAEWFESVDMESLAVQATERALLMLKADYAPAGEMPVVIDAGFGGVIFHEACGHGLETTSVAKGASVFCGKLGEKVAADCVTAIDDGTLQGGWGSLGCDDEGRATERTVLIENGVLKSYMVDRLGSLRTGYACTGSARRESYRFAPTSRMRNTFIAAGQDSLESMIADIDDGLYAKEMGGGSVSPGTGDFNFSVVEAYRIRRGRVEEAVKGATLVGRGIETLGRITRVGRELRLQDGMCGSVSGTIPAAVGQPPITVSSILVGGRTR
ncbi:MAG TPA: TldD/PmbA family protein [Pseudobdellovibrionaceae bacterium]|nr:TldD/PmbA family protein [Pseudobdellovibrionaceae bacterium]